MRDNAHGFRFAAAYDKDNLKLYVSLDQVFSIWVIPFHAAPVSLTTVLDLETEPADRVQKTGSGSNMVQAGGKTRYYIQKQEDLYQTSEFIKFVMPYGGQLLVFMWHAFASLFSILGVFVLWPIMWAEERGYFDHHDRIANDAREGVAEALNGHVPELKMK